MSLFVEAISKYRRIVPFYCRINSCSRDDLHVRTFIEEQTVRAMFDFPFVRFVCSASYRVCANFGGDLT